MYTQHNTTQHPFEKFRQCGGFEKTNFGRKFRDHFMAGNHPLKDMFDRKINNYKPVNIIESDGHFTVQLFAAGLKKELFKVAIKDQVLTISYTQDDESTDSHIVYQEFYEGSFERRFQLTDKVFDDQVSAMYENGVLTVVLPKNPDKNKPEQNVDIH
ncbi:Hsp20/alpha crystallin family protein [Chryseobacterium pennipullorum]|uniref:Hsp20/alpha crystallin family protein n=1 Tax=Chryseobacterium pennipullorum TaxID=2258963 RepID=A0A3D9B4M4_9FLAO|nr:Hsp20 family protein [Chryseobacterium pennipullorum]REC48268.1 Hsp20/alpha crystallin family protein [Chryseobacterium pennipullorum]